MSLKTKLDSDFQFSILLSNLWAMISFLAENFIVKIFCTFMSVMWLVFAIYCGVKNEKD
jgi:type IV secretory pathway TrbL component